MAIKALSSSISILVLFANVCMLWGQQASDEHILLHELKKGLILSNKVMKNELMWSLTKETTILFEENDRYNLIQNFVNLYKYRDELINYAEPGKQDNALIVILNLALSSSCKIIKHYAPSYNFDCESTSQHHQMSLLMASVSMVDKTRKALKSYKEQNGLSSCPYWLSRSFINKTDHVSTYINKYGQTSQC